jgi:hypothetical protein
MIGNFRAMSLARTSVSLNNQDEGVNVDEYLNHSDEDAWIESEEKGVSSTAPTSTIIDITDDHDTSENGEDQPKKKKLKPNKQVHIKKVVSEEDGMKVITIECRYCDKKWGPYDYNKWKKGGSSTSTATAHVDNKHQDKIQGSNSIENYFHKESNQKTTSKEDFENAYSLFFIGANTSFLMSENVFFRNLLEKSLLLDPKENIKLPKADTTSTKALEKVGEIQLLLIAKLNGFHGKIHFVFDAWTSSNYKSFLGVNYQAMNKDWEIVNELLCFKEIFDHSGSGIAAVLLEVLQNYKLDLSKVGCITGDNASSVDTAVDEFEKLITAKQVQGWKSKERRIRCMAHIINLSCKEFMKALKSIENSNVEEDFYTEINDEELDEVSYNDEDDNIADWKETQNKDEWIIRKLRQFIKKLRASPTQRYLYLEECDTSKVPPLMLVLDVPTRWNSTFYMIKRYLQMKDVVNLYIERQKPIVGKVHLKDLKLSDSEVEILQEICNHLSIFEESTRYMSARDSLLSTVIPSFTVLFNYIEDKMESNISTLTKDALTKSHELLGKYYGKLEDPYVTATLLDPRFKRKWFSDQAYDTLYPGFIERFERKIIRKMQVMDDFEDMNPATPIPNRNTSYFHTSMFSTNNNVASGPGDQLDEYNKFQNFPREDPEVNVLQWWGNHSKQFPKLARFAMEFLSAAPSSVSVESEFNQGRDVYGIRRHSLKSTTTEKIMVGRAHAKMLLK